MSVVKADSNQDLTLTEKHEYNVLVDSSDPDSDVANEIWGVEIRQGDMLTLIAARNLTQSQGNTIDYQLGVHYDIDGTTYVAQFMILNMDFKIGGYTISAMLSSCSDFDMAYSSVDYDGSYYTATCNITFHNISVCAQHSANSTMDLTLCHLISSNKNETNIKVEAILDLTKTQLFMNDNEEDIEYAAGTSFAAEIIYQMQLGNSKTGQMVFPSSHTETSLQYNLTLSDGTPLSFSKLNMSNAFSINGTSGNFASTGYSSMTYSVPAEVTHGFPNLTYKDTVSVHSDPEITIYHNSVSNGSNGTQWFALIIVSVVAIAGASVFILWRRKKKA